MSVPRTLRGTTVASILTAMSRAVRAMEAVPAVVAVGTDVSGAVGELRIMRDVLMHTAIGDLGVHAPDFDLLANSSPALELDQ
jgi:hypothetical protein